jgi:hypothetical protein
VLRCKNVIAKAVANLSWSENGQSLLTIQTQTDAGCAQDAAAIG